MSSFEVIERNAKVGPHGCWLWTASTSGDGYGQVTYRGRNWAAHRLSYTMYKGDIPAGLLVRHTCDTPICVNPRHLLVGTHKDNAADCTERGRHRNQVKTHCTKGHPLSGDNLRIRTRSDGRKERQCWTCRRINRRR